MWLYSCFGVFGVIIVNRDLKDIIGVERILKRFLRKLIKLRINCEGWIKV